MARRFNEFESMIHSNPATHQESYEKEIIGTIKLNESERLKQYIFVNSLSRIEDDVLNRKCSDIITHYRIFNSDESYFKVEELSDEEKDKLKKCIGECIQKECARIIKEKKSIPAGMTIFNT